MGQVRLMVWVDEDLRAALKVEAVKEGITLRELVTRKLSSSASSRKLEEPIPGTQALFKGQDDGR